MERADKKTKQPTGASARVLIPVDFSPKGSLALKVGFELARRLEKDVTLLHASVVADPMIEPQFPDDFNGLDNENTEIEEMEMSEQIHRIDSRSMHELETKIKQMQESRSYPSVEFNTVLSPGMPEEVIAEYCTFNPPAVVVMATRGCQKRREELIGSVTAEVIDHSIAPVFTVPEDYSFAGFKQIVRICAFCFCDEGDMAAISRLMEMFDNPSVKLYLFPATDKYKGDQLAMRLNQLEEKLKERYPNSEFITIDTSNEINLREKAESVFIKDNIQMILAPNKRRNALARFFSPGLAHKILYEIDFPMLAIPV